MCIFYINIKIKVVPKVKYLGLFFDDTADSSPGAEDREAPAERARYGFTAKLKKMGPMTVADKIRMEFVGCIRLYRLSTGRASMKVILIDSIPMINVLNERGK